MIWWQALVCISPEAWPTFSGVLNSHMLERSHQIVAMDGPAASGKSSVARKLAQRLGFVYVNSGAIYRAITWHLLQNRIRPEDSERIAEALDSAALTCVVRRAEA